MSNPPFPQWMGGHQQFQLTDDIPVPTEEQVCLDPILDRSQTHLLQPCGLSNDESRVTQVCERGSAPEIEGASKGFRGPRRVPSGQLLGTLRRGAAKLLDINGHAGAKAVPRSGGLDGISTKASPQRRNVHVHGIDHRGRRVTAPQARFELRAAHPSGCSEGKQRHDCCPARPTRGDNCTVASEQSLAEKVDSQSLRQRCPLACALARAVDRLHHLPPRGDRNNVRRHLSAIDKWLFT